MYLDLRHLGAEKIKDKLPGIRDLAIHFEGVDPVEEPVPILPSQHYSMGGIDTDMDGQTSLPGFYAAGECACVSVHGGNRLGGNSLLETVVFGRRAGVAASQYIRSAKTGKDVTPAAERTVAGMEARVGELAARGAGGEDPYAIRAGMTATMKDHFGVFREAPTMQAGLDTMHRLKERVGTVGLRHNGAVLNLDMIRTVELEGMVDVALAIAAGALARTESRGSHSRTDYPDRNDADWLKHTLAYYRPEGPRLASKPVTLGMFEPQERKY